MKHTPYRILFVCMGNICRSPAGEGVFRRLIKENGYEDLIQCDSAGTIGFHEGHPPDSRMSAAAARRDIPLSGQARKLKSADLEKFDLILTMDEENYRNVQAMARGEEQAKKIKRFCEFCANFSDTEVPDPYYGGHQGFEHVMDLLEDGCNRLLMDALKKARARSA